MAYIRNVLVLGFMAILFMQMTGCGRTGSSYGSGRDGAPSENIDVSKIPNAVPKKEARHRSANPKSYVVRGKRHYVMKDASNYNQKGYASWYGTKFHGRRTAMGESYDLKGMTAAHKTLPLPSYVRVTNLKNGREVIVRVNDRGPFHSDRIIDLSYVAAKKLGMLPTGTGHVRVQIIDPSKPNETISESSSSGIIMPDQEGKQKLYLQMGVFADKGNAEKMARSIEKNIQAPVQVKSDKHNNKLVYRVRVPVPNESKANVLYDQLAQKGLGRPVRVVE